MFGGPQGSPDVAVHRSPAHSANGCDQDPIRGFFVLARGKNCGIPVNADALHANLTICVPNGYAMYGYEAP